MANRVDKNAPQYWCLIRRYGEVLKVRFDIRCIDQARSLLVNNYPTADRIDLFRLKDQLPAGMLIRTKEGNRWGKTMWVSVHPAWEDPAAKKKVSAWRLQRLDLSCAKEVLDELDAIEKSEPEPDAAAALASRHERKPLYWAEIFCGDIMLGVENDVMTMAHAGSLFQVYETATRLQLHSVKTGKPCGTLHNTGWNSQPTVIGGPRHGDAHIVAGIELQRERLRLPDKKKVTDGDVR